MVAPESRLAGDHPDLVDGEDDDESVESFRASFDSDVVYDRHGRRAREHTRRRGRLDQPLASRPHRIRKRSIDLIVAIPAMIVSLPIIGIVAILIKRADRGPVFYKQIREGLHGKPIVVWKIRTMHVDADDRLKQHLSEFPAASEEWRSSFKLRHDPRILPGVGHFLRRTSLDELPQFLNVVRGDMSLIGPRPLPGYHLETYDERFRELRKRVLPGLSGLWQTSSRSDGDLHDLERLDTYYIRNWSFRFDLFLLFKTVAAVVVGRGAY